MPGCLVIKFNNAFVFPDPEPPVISIPYGCSGIYGHFKIMVYFIFICIVIKVNHLHLINISLSHTLKAFPCGCVVILSKICNLLSSLLLSAILLISSLYTL